MQVLRRVIGEHSKSVTSVEAVRAYALPCAAILLSSKLTLNEDGRLVIMIG
jgi:hypothetical protein